MHSPSQNSTTTPLLDGLFHELCADVSHAWCAKVQAGEPLLQADLDAARQTMASAITTRRADWQNQAAAKDATLTTLTKSLATDLSFNARTCLKQRRCGAGKAAVSLPDETPLDQAHELTNSVTTREIFWKLFAGWVAVLASALLDIALMFDAQHRSYLDALGRFTGNPVTLAAISCSSLAAFWLIGMAWNSGTKQDEAATSTRRTVWIGHTVAIVGYGAVLALLCARIAASYGDLFTAAWEQGHNVFEGATSTAPLWVSYAGIVLAACFYSLGGLLFILSKHYLGRVYALRAALRECQRRIALNDQVQTVRATRDTIRAAIDESQKSATVTAMMKLVDQCALAAAQGAIQQRKQQAEAVLSDVLATRGEKGAAKSTIDALDRMSQTARVVIVAVVVLVMASALPVLAASSPAESTGEIFRKAGAFVVMLDLSPSPGTNSSYVAAILPEIGDALRNQPVGTLVRVHGFGNPTVGDRVLFRARIQAVRTPEGDTRESIERQLKAQLLKVSSDYARHVHHRSEILNAVADGSALVNPRAKHNQLILITDGNENSDVCAFQPGVVCKLPAPKFTFTKTSVAMYGVGQGLQGSDAQKTIREWRGFLKAAGAASVIIRRE
ncbi:MAG: hypothetical protein WBK08_15380 [Nitrospira sp.]